MQREARAAWFEPVDFEERIARDARRSRVELANVASHHQTHNLFGRHRSLSTTDEAAVAEHDDAIADLAHLLDEVRNVDDRVTPCLEATNQRKQMGDVVTSQAAGGLVEDHDAGANCHRTRDLDELLLGNRKLANELLGSEARAPKLRQRTGCQAPHRLPVDHADPRRFHSKQDVFCDREVGCER